MKKLILPLFILIVLTGKVYSQQYGSAKSIAIKRYNKGVKQFKKENYIKAIKYFNLSISARPHKDTYYNRAICNLKLGDHENYCMDLMNARLYGDKTLEKLYNNKCLKKDTTFFAYGEIVDNNKEWDSFRITYIDNIMKDTFYKTLNKSKQAVEVFTLKEGDTLYKKGTLNLIKPQFPGGDDSLMVFIAETIEYPKEARMNSISGNAFTSFIIEKDGSLSNFKIKKKLGYGLDAESRRVYSKLPDWEPAKYKNRNARFLYEFNIMFNYLGVVHLRDIK